MFSEQKKPLLPRYYDHEDNVDALIEEEFEDEETLGWKKVGRVGEKKRVTAGGTNIVPLIIVIGLVLIVSVAIVGVVMVLRKKCGNAKAEDVDPTIRTFYHATRTKTLAVRFYRLQRSICFQVVRISMVSVFTCHPILAYIRHRVMQLLERISAC